jgi:FixJ family two-component response regulator
MLRTQLYVMKIRGSHSKFALMNTPISISAQVFVVDDDAAVRDSIKILLEVHGFRVEDFASTGAFAKGYRKPSRGCLILDQHLPLTTGLDFLRSPAGKGLGIPVILITAQGDPKIERRARDAGVAEYLQKPIAQNLLLSTVERVLDQGASASA